MIGGLEQLHNKYKKQILFTSIGYCSGKCNDHTSTEADLESQKNRYQAMIETFEDVPWLEGAFFFGWTVDPSFGGTYDTCATVQHKPAEELVRSVYGGGGTSQKYETPARCPCVTDPSMSG